MKQLNEEILNQSFGMENDSIYELTIRLSGYEKVIIPPLFRQFLFKIKFRLLFI